MRRLSALILAAILLAVSPASSQISIPFPGPGGIGAADVIGTPQTLGGSGAGSNSSCSTSNTQTMTTSNPVSSGDTLVVAAGQLNGTNAITSVSDGTNSYIKAVSSGAGVGGITVEIWYKLNASAVGGGATLTVTWTGAATFCQVTAARVTGPTAIDVTPAATNGTSTAPSISSGTLATAKEGVFGAVYTNGGATNTANAPFTQLSCVGICTNNAGVGMSLEYDVTTTTASVTDAPTLGQSRAWLAVMASFK